ncbi:hypothetical protein [Haloferula sp. BvORR071]|uniref:hypothetical protein n=1 Tax=Haloferula sp. BvORR071 TaxID=1396141 RepID=UPI0005597BA8|nr:hypothetical protein [Haloferula sp. BvORR071]
MTRTFPSLLAALGAFLPAALFAAAPTYTTGDLFMGFRATEQPGDTSVLLVNIGSAAAFRDATSPITLTAIGDIGEDLKALYGANWRSRTDLQWGVAGTPSNNADVNGDTVPTLYASRQQTAPGVPGTGWQVSGSSTRLTVATTMTNLQDGFKTYSATTANSTKAIIQGTTDGASWRQFMAPDGSGTYTTGGKDFGAFANIEGSSAVVGSEGLANVTLSLFRVTGSAAGSFEGTFSIDAAGTVTFTPPAAAGTTYATWAATNAGGQAHNLDFDNDGVDNGIEFFMGQNGSTFTANPPMIGGSVTWPRASDRTVSSFGVEVSTDLVSWGPATPANVVITPTSVTYTPPTGQARHFLRLRVTP